MTTTPLAHKTTALALAVTAFAPLSFVGCGPNLAERIAPKPKTYVEAVDNGECKRDGVAGNPLIVDWPPEQRGDLEIAMKENIPVVRYTCERFELLRECHIRGGYQYLGMTRKEQLVRILSQDELRANLPFSNLGLPVSLKGELDRDASLDIALVMIGKKSTNLTSATEHELEGKCTGATHFVRRATLGAFAMDIGTKAHAGEAASLFGFEQKGDSKYQKRLFNKDGDPTACNKSTSGSESAPEQCGALLRLELSSITSTERENQSSTAGAETSACPHGMRQVNDKCTATITDCEGKRCDAECDGGSKEACLLGAQHLEKSDGGGHRRISLLAKGCKLGSDEGCLLLAWMFPSKSEPSADMSATYLELLVTRCEAGTTLACFDAGQILWEGTKVDRDQTRGLKLLERACNGGSSSACLTVAIDAQKHAPAKSLRYLNAACTLRPTTLDEAEACLRLGEANESGNGVTKDDRQAAELYARACLVLPGNLDAVALRRDGRREAPNTKACEKRRALAH